MPRIFGFSIPIMFFFSFIPWLIFWGKARGEGREGIEEEDGADQSTFKYARHEDVIKHGFPILFIIFNLNTIFSKRIEKIAEKDLWRIDIY